VSHSSVGDSSSSSCSGRLETKVGTTFFKAESTAIGIEFTAVARWDHEAKSRTSPRVKCLLKRVAKPPPCLFLSKSNSSGGIDSGSIISIFLSRTLSSSLGIGLSVDLFRSSTIRTGQVGKISSTTFSIGNPLLGGFSSFTLGLGRLGVGTVGVGSTSIISIFHSSTDRSLKVGLGALGSVSRIDWLTNHSMLDVLVGKTSSSNGSGLGIGQFMVDWFRSSTISFTLSLGSFNLSIVSRFKEAGSGTHSVCSITVLV
jgi:hypothetical protein